MLNSAKFVLNSPSVAAAFILLTTTPQNVSNKQTQFSKHDADYILHLIYARLILLLGFCFLLYCCPLRRIGNPPEIPHGTIQWK